MGEYDEVEVWIDYTGAWGGGFELHDVELDGLVQRFRVRRRSDGSVLPESFSGTEIRPPQSPRDGDERVPPHPAIVP